MKIARSVSELRLEGEVGLVPTMGALHAGHISLFERARAENDVVVASLFVNPAQFDEQADLARYPRDAARDEEVAEQAGVDVLFAPRPEEMYPPGFGTWVDVEGLGAGRLTVLTERDLLDTGFGLTQEPVAMGLQRFAPLIDEDRSLKLHIAFLKALDDGLELLQRLLEAHRLDVGMV